MPLWWIIFVFLVVRWAIKISYFVQTWKFSKFRNSFLIIFLSFHGYIKLKKTLNFKLPQTSWFTFAVWKVSKYKVFSGLYLPAFRLNTERYGVSLRIQSECGKMRIRIIPNTDAFYTVFTQWFNDVMCTKIFYLFYCNPKEKDHIRRKINSKKIKIVYMWNQYYYCYFDLSEIRVGRARKTKNYVAFTLCKMLKNGQTCMKRLNIMKGSVAYK